MQVTLNHPQVSYCGLPTWASIVHTLDGDFLIAYSNEAKTGPRINLKLFGGLHSLSQEKSRGSFLNSSRQRDPNCLPYHP